MLLARVAQTSQSVAATSGRRAKIEQLARLLRELGPDEARIAVSWLAGELPQRQIGVGWAALRDVPAGAEAPSWSVTDVHRRFDDIKAATGPGSQSRRRELLSSLMAGATEVEQQFLRGLLSGGLRQGALAGVMTDAIAQAGEVPIDLVRRAAMLSGDLAGTAALALSGGAAALATVGLLVGRPIAPMLAQSAASVADAFTDLGTPLLLQAKLDGARIQAHKSGLEVALFTRSLDEVTGRMPEVAAAVRALPARDLVLDGEVLTLRSDGRPAPFQSTASRVGTRDEPAAGDRALTAVFFDLMHLDGRDLLDESTVDRIAALESVIAPADRIGQLITADPDAARGFLADTLAAGHEGIVAKALDARYEAGRRGAGWRKIKPVHTLDLVVLAVEWGSGRRQGWLSNIHLGARDPANGDQFVMLGKTFKGMTDEMLRWQTARFLELAIGPSDGWVVALAPVQVVEIAFDGVQRSTRYPGGVALRFARVLRYRDDKSAAEADTLETVRSYLM